MSRFRIGQGFDVHRFDGERRLVLCGLEIEDETGLAGHSDADVALHAVCDALLGAVAAGDIGEHFPSSDEGWRDADSAVFLRHALDCVRAAGCGLVNCDLTLIGERPRIERRRDAMRHNLAELLDTEISRVSVKATSTDDLGFTGRGEGLAAMAVVLVEEVENE